MSKPGDEEKEWKKKNKKKKKKKKKSELVRARACLNIFPVPVHVIGDAGDAWQTRAQACGLACTTSHQRAQVAALLASPWPQRVHVVSNKLIEVAVGASALISHAFSPDRQ